MYLTVFSTVSQTQLDLAETPQERLEEEVNSLKAALEDPSDHVNYTLSCHFN